MAGQQVPGLVTNEMSLNPFRLLGDCSHIISKCILIWAMYRNRSAEGVSLLTQMLYAMIFLARYLDLLRKSGWSKFYLVFFKLFYIFSSFLTIFLMMKVFPRTREREKAWRLAIWSVGASALLGPFVLLWYPEYPDHWFTESFWAFSIVLESVCVLPQLLLLRQTTVPTVIDSYYLLALGSYRGFYILNWVWRWFEQRYFDSVAVVFGIIQTAFYIDFAWVYYSRQRVKLRNGAVIDSEDYGNSWLVNKVLSFRTRRTTDEEEEILHDGESEGDEETDGRSRSNRWGARGISVSADDTLDNQGRPHKAHRDDAHGEDDEEVEGILEDEDDIGARDSPSHHH